MYIVNLIGMVHSGQVLIRLLGADGHLYASYTESMKWIEETGVLELIMDKFRSSVSSFLRNLFLPQECLHAFLFCGDSFFLGNC